MNGKASTDSYHYSQMCLTLKNDEVHTFTYIVRVSKVDIGVSNLKSDMVMEYYLFITIA